MPALAKPYRPRRPQDTRLHRVVREHLETFLEHARESYDAPLPKYVRDELRGYLRCGIFEHGFLRARRRAVIRDGHQGENPRNGREVAAGAAVNPGVAQHPYRTASPAAEPRRPIGTTRASALPLGVMALAFFLPAAEDCNRVVVSPLDYAARSPWFFVWLAPTYLAAALLVAAIVRTQLMHRAANRIALAALGLVSTASCVMVAAALVRHKYDGLIVYTALLPSLAVAWFALRRRFGRRRFALLLDAYAFAAVPIVVLNAEVASHWGGYVFVGAYALFALIRVVRLLLRAPPRRATAPAC